MTVSRMTEKQITRAYHDGKVTLKQYQDRLRSIGTSRHAAELKRDPMKRYYATGALPGSRPRKPKKAKKKR